jgi:hypothetical protein
MLYQLLGANALRGEITREQRTLAQVEAMLLPVVRSLSYHRLDNIYWVCPKADMLKLIENDWLNKRQYLADAFDCDDYAFAFKATISQWYGLNGVGIVVDYSSAHAYNLVLFSDDPPQFYEPQSDAWVTLGAENYKGDDGLVLL